MLFILYICFGFAFLSLIVLGIINILILPKKKILSRICFGISVFEIFFWNILSLNFGYTKYILNVFFNKVTHLALFCPVTQLTWNECALLPQSDLPIVAATLVKRYNKSRKQRNFTISHSLIWFIGGVFSSCKEPTEKPLLSIDSASIW